MSSGHFFDALIHPPESDEVVWVFTGEGYRLAAYFQGHWVTFQHPDESFDTDSKTSQDPDPIYWTHLPKLPEKMCQSALRLLGYRRERDWMARRDTIRYFLLEPGLTDEQRRWLARMFDKLGSSPPKSSEESEIREQDD